MKIKEIKTHHVDDNNIVHIDAYFDSDPNSSGKTIAIVCLDTLKVFWVDSVYSSNNDVLEKIRNIQLKRKELMETAWDFVGLNYPKYHSSSDIADALDIDCLVEKEYEEDSSANELLQSDYNGEIDNPKIKQDYESIHFQIYERAIEEYYDMLSSNIIQLPGG